MNFDLFTFLFTFVLLLCEFSVRGNWFRNSFSKQILFKSVPKSEVKVLRGPTNVPFSCISCIGVLWRRGFMNVP